jgi:hypothetical protein
MLIQYSHEKSQRITADWLAGRSPAQLSIPPGGVGGGCLQMHGVRKGIKFWQGWHKFFLVSIREFRIPEGFPTVCGHHTVALCTIIGH